MSKVHTEIRVMASIITLSLISSCSFLPESVSKDCDELATKGMKASFSKASENNGEFIRDLVLVKSQNGKKITTYITHYNSNLTYVAISSTGKITRNTYEDLPVAINSTFTSTKGVLTKPIVLTDRQISCEFFKYLFIDYRKVDGSFGTNVIISENEKGIRFKFPD